MRKILKYFNVLVQVAAALDLVLSAANDLEEFPPIPFTRKGKRFQIAIERVR